MKKIFILFLVIITPFCCQRNSICTQAEAEYYYTTNVEHLFTHCLISYPEIAFNKNNYMSKYYNADCLTINEFSKILTCLYQNNYVLVSINECFEVKNNTAIKKKIKVPINKKPLIISFDDVNYDSKKIGKGMVDKIILDENGSIATSTKIGNKIDISYNNEFVTILEEFIKKHPDFSLNKARGTINLTGYDGILGYRTSGKNTQNRQDEIDNAKKVVQALKDLGWNFACHSYGHYHMKNISIDKFKTEMTNWKTEVEPIIGKTKIYVYPYGEWEVFNQSGEICEKHKLLAENGFYLFCGVGMKTFYSYLPNKKHKILFMDRKCLDGNTLRANHKELARFFNPLTILDSIRENLDKQNSI